MPLPRVRFTVRSLMIAVAIVAVAFGGYFWAVEMRRLSRDYAFKAQSHSKMEDLLLESVAQETAMIERYRRTFSEEYVERNASLSRALPKGEIDELDAGRRKIVAETREELRRDKNRA